MVERADLAVTKGLRPMTHDHAHSRGVPAMIKEIFAPHFPRRRRQRRRHPGIHCGRDPYYQDQLVGSLTALIQIVIVAGCRRGCSYADTIHNFADALTAVPLWIAFALGAARHSPIYLRIRWSRRGPGRAVRTR